MENKDKNVFFSSIKYHLLFSTRYLRKVFKDEEIKQRFIEITKENCSRQGLKLIEITCETNHVYLYVEATSSLSPHGIVASIKQASSSQLRREFPEQTHTNALWNRSYCVSTTKRFSESVVNDYLNAQKKYR